MKKQHNKLKFGKNLHIIITYSILKTQARIYLHTCITWNFLVKTKHSSMEFNFTWRKFYRNCTNTYYFIFISLFDIIISNNFFYRITVQKEGPNKGRPFYGCPKDFNSRCNFFKWADEESWRPGTYSIIS